MAARTLALGLAVLLIALVPLAAMAAPEDDSLTGAIDLGDNGTFYLDVCRLPVGNLDTPVFECLGSGLYTEDNDVAGLQTTAGQYEDEQGRLHVYQPDSKVLA